MLKNSVRSVSALLMGASLAACPLAPKDKAEITLAIESNTTSVVVGQTIQLTAIVEGTDNTAVTWESANTAIATVSAAGVVTGVSAGVTSVRALSVEDPEVYTDATITVTAPVGGTYTPLTSGSSVVVSGIMGSAKDYTIAVPAGATRLLVTTSGGSGDVDLYVNSAPITASSPIACESESSTNAETCDIANPAAGTWYIHLLGYMNFSGVTLTATVTAGGSGGGGGGGTTSVFVATEFVANFDNGCALNAAGKAYCWGDNTQGVLGIGSSGTGHANAPVAVNTQLTFTKIDASLVNACALTAAGAAYCWGDNSQGTLGNGDASGTDIFTPTAVSGGLTFTQISVGRLDVCAITTSQQAYCWGSDSEGQLGDAMPYSSKRVPTLVSGGLSWKKISAGETHVCGLTTSGAAYCWGDNSAGQLGNTSYSTDQLAPSPVMAGTTFSDIEAGRVMACGLTTAGVVHCWGGVFGQQGSSGSGYQVPPTVVSNGITFASISVGDSKGCGLTAAGAAYCWGYSAAAVQGQTMLGNYAAAAAAFPGYAFSRISAGQLGLACGNTISTSTIVCWGGETLGGRGDGPTFKPESTPSAVLAP